MILQLSLLLLTCLNAVMATTPRHNVYRGQKYNWLETKSFKVQQITIAQISELITETIFSRSHLQCISHCLGNTKCAGILYDEQQNCHLLSATTGIREQASESGSVQVILYGIEDGVKVKYM